MQQPVEPNGTQNPFRSDEIPNAQLTENWQPQEQVTVELLEERLAVERKRRKVGEVVVHRKIETKMIEVPVRYEKLIVEQIGAGQRKFIELDWEKHNDAIAPNQDSTTNGNAGVVVGEYQSFKCALQALDAVSDCALIKINLVLNGDELEKSYHEFTSPKTARRVMRGMLRSLSRDCRLIHIELFLSDQSKQATYQEWFDHFHQLEQQEERLDIGTLS